jgi:ferredoxin
VRTVAGIPEFFRINFSRCIFCGMCEEACPTTAIQLTPDFEMAEYNRQNLVYEKEHLLISGPGKYPDYNFYRVSGMAIAGKPKGAAQNESQPVDIKSCYPEEQCQIAFYIAAAVAILATLRVITNANPVHALLNLIMSLLAVAVIFLPLARLLPARWKSLFMPAPSWCCSYSW